MSKHYIPHPTLTIATSNPKSSSPVSAPKCQKFKRKLPLSVLLLTNAIGRLKEEVGKSERGQIKAACDLNNSPRGVGSEIMVVVDSDKKTWMRPAQLWSSDQTSFQKLNTLCSGEILQRGRSDGPQMRQMRIVECLVGDETRMIIFTAGNDQGRGY